MSKSVVGVQLALGLGGAAHPIMATRDRCRGAYWQRGPCEDPTLNYG